MTAALEAIKGFLHLSTTSTERSSRPVRVRRVLTILDVLGPPAPQG